MSDLVTYTHGMVNHYASLLDERARSGPALARMQETILGLFQSNDALAKAAASNQRSLCDAVLSALNLGLSFQPSLGQAYLVPRKGRVCFQLGYRGLMELARRSGGVVLMASELVYPGDRFEVSLGTDRRLVHIPDPWGTGRTYESLLGAYATATLAGGAVDFEVMPKVEIERRRAVSMSTSGPWRDWPEEMARKTVLRSLLKRLPLSVEAADLLKRDYEDDDPRGAEVRIIEGVRPAATVQRVQHPLERPAIAEPFDDAEVDEPTEAPGDNRPLPPEVAPWDVWWAYDTAQGRDPDELKTLVPTHARNRAEKLNRFLGFMRNGQGKSIGRPGILNLAERTAEDVPTATIETMLGRLEVSQWSELGGDHLAGFVAALLRERERVTAAKKG